MLRVEVPGCVKVTARLAHTSEIKSGSAFVVNPESDHRRGIDGAGHIGHTLQLHHLVSVDG